MIQIQPQIDAARLALREPEDVARSRDTLAAAALAACAAILLAGVMVFGSGVVIEDPAPISASA